MTIKGVWFFWTNILIGRPPSLPVALPASFPAWLSSVGKTFCHHEPPLAIKPTHHSDCWNNSAFQVVWHTQHILIQSNNYLGWAIWFILASQRLLPCSTRLPAVTCFIRLGQGTLFGLGVWGAFHLGVMPAMGTVPSPKDQPVEEHVSEALGHIAWMWTNHIISDKLYQQLTSK